MNMELTRIDKTGYVVSDVIDDVIDFLNDHDSYVILGHIEPDGDCVGAQLVMRSWLRRNGKKAVALTKGPFSRAETEGFAASFDKGDPEDHPGAVVIVDCSSPDRTGFGDITGRPSLVVDHHATGKPFGDLRFVDSGFPSATLLILSLMEENGDTPTAEEAELMFFGFCTDTGFFRHLDETGAEAMVSVSKLMRLGASPNRAYRQIYGGWRLDQVVLLGEMLSRTESFAGGKVLVSWQTVEDRGRAGDSPRGSDDYYRYMQAIDDCEVVVFIRQESDRECSVGLRSRNDFDVAELARSMGGGGHIRASGYLQSGTIDQVKTNILGELSHHFQL